MRPWFTFIVTFILVFALLVLLFVVNFVLTNRQVFETKFDIIIMFPYVGWSHTWVGVQFMYIIAGSLLLGALIIAITTLGLDTKRVLKLRSMRKELKRLQEALQKAQTLPEIQKQEEEEQIPEVREEPLEFTESLSATPEDITKSFEDTIQKEEFLGRSKKRSEEEQTDRSIAESDGRSKGDGEIRDRETGPEQELGEEQPEDSTLDKDKKLSKETPVEAEVIENAEFSEEEQNSKENGT
jgi:hypothetical protein